MRVLIIEDDVRLARVMSEVLADEKIDVDLAQDGDTGLDLALRGIHDVVIVDWMLPGRDGPAVCRAIRAARLPVSVLMLTARIQVEDRVAGLDSGADDYLVKPFAFSELSARLRALSRRFAPGATDAYELRWQHLVMDVRAHQARWGERLLDLTHTEWRLLEFLMRHPGQALTRQQILDYVWSLDSDVLQTQVDVFITYLRRKLNSVGAMEVIQTVRGIGYRLGGDHV